MRADSEALAGLQHIRRSFKFQSGRSGNEIFEHLQVEEKNTPPSPAEMERMGKLVEDGMKAGWLLATEGCMPSALGARVRCSGGSITVKDGPFTESKEVVGGFAILSAKSKEEAIELARDFLRVVGDGECELRQIDAADAAPCTDQAAKA